MPQLEILCPRTQLCVPTGIATDAKSLALTWALKLTIECPHCGEEHKIEVREAYIDGALRDVQAALARVIY